MPPRIFVFGSNTAGRHGAGAAKTARETYGAATGIWYGPTGRSYAIPTKNAVLETLPINDIRSYVDMFSGYAKSNPKLQFTVTAIGCGLAGYDHADMAPLFFDCPNNCWFDSRWKPYLGNGRNYFDYGG